MTPSHNSRARDGDDGGDDDRPWSEERWERFMKEGDARSARYGELLETLIDHPDRDEIVAREMGWDDLADELAAERVEGVPDGGGGESWKPAPGGADQDDASEEFNDDPLDDDDDDDPVESIPAYNLAMDVAEQVHDALEPWLSKPVPEGGERDARAELTGELVGEAFIGCRIAAAKISGGHAMGYEDEVLCGNIVNCRRGLEGAENCERALVALRDRKLVPAEIVDPLLPRVRKVVEAVRQRIEELRARVWW